MRDVYPILFVVQCNPFLATLQCINGLSGIPVLAVALARLIYDVRTTSGCLYLGATQCLGGNGCPLVVNGNVIHGSLSLM